MVKKNTRASVKQTEAPEVIAETAVGIVTSKAAVETGLVVIEESAEPVEIITTQPLATLVAMEELAAVEEPIEEPAAEVVEVADVVLRLPGLLTATAAREMAAFYAGKLGLPLEMVRHGVTMETVFPGRGGARAAAMPRQAVRTEGNANLGRAMAMLGGSEPAPKQERDWTTWSAVEAWGGNPASYAQSYVKQWRKMDAEATDLNLDALLEYDFAGSHEGDTRGNTFQKHMGKYLRATIARVRAAIAERDADRQAEADRIAAQFEQRMQRLAAA